MAVHDVGLAALAAAYLDVQVADVAVEPALGHAVGRGLARPLEFVLAAPAVVGNVGDKSLEALAEDLVEDEFRFRRIAHQIGKTLLLAFEKEAFRRENGALPLQALRQELAQGKRFMLVQRFLLGHEKELLVNGTRVIQPCRFQELYRETRKLANSF